MRMEIKYDKKLYKFNLYEELRIDEDVINQDMQEHPRIYGFLSMIHNIYIKLAKEAKLNADKKEAQLFKMYKSKTGDNGRPLANELAKANTESNPSYTKMRKNQYKIEHDRDNLAACVRMFEERKALIQTISANRRREI